MSIFVKKSTQRGSRLFWEVLVLLLMIMLGTDYQVMAGFNYQLSSQEVSSNTIELFQDDDNEGFGPVVPLTITGSVNVRNASTISADIVGAFENITIYGRLFGSNDGYDWYFISEEPDVPNFVRANGSARFIAAVPGVVEVGDPIVEATSSEIPLGPDAGGVKINPAPAFSIIDMSDSIANLVTTTEARIPDIEETLDITVVEQQWMNDGNVGSFENIPPVLILRTQASVDAFGDFILQDMAEGTPAMIVPMNGENLIMSFSTLDGLQLNLLQALAINAGVNTAEEFVTFLENLVTGEYEGIVRAYNPESDDVEELTFDPALPLIIIHEGIWQHTTGTERLEREDINQGYRQALEQFVVRFTVGEGGQLQMQLWMHQTRYERAVQLLQDYPDYATYSFPLTVTDDITTAIRALYTGNLHGALFTSLEGEFENEMEIAELTARIPGPVPGNLLIELNQFWPIYVSPGSNPNWTLETTDPTIFSMEMKYQSIVPSVILDYVNEID